MGRCAEQSLEGVVRIVVENIRSKGRQVRFSKADDWARDAAEKALDGQVSDLSGELDLQRRGQDVHVHAQAQATAKPPCHRCGRPVEVAVESEEQLLYKPAVAGREDDHHHEVELSDTDLDVGWYDDGALELSAVVAELLALAAPSRVLCEDVASCEKASGLNEQQDEVEGNSAFAALKDLL